MRATLAVAVLGLAVLAPRAAASPMEDSSLGGAVFTGPTQGHTSAFFVNPAALGLTGRGWHLHIGGSARLNSIWVDRRVLGSGGQLETGDSTSDHTLSPGGIIAWYRSFQSDTARFGVSLYTPSYQRFPEGGDALGYHSRGGQLIQGMLTLAGSYRLGGRVIMGLGISVGYSAMQYRFSRDRALDGGSEGINADCGDGRCGYEHPAARETYDITVGSETPLQGLLGLQNVSASIGAMVRLPGESWLGMGYVALPGAFGKLSLAGTATVQRAEIDGGGQESATAEIGLRMAQLVFVGYRRPLTPTFDLITDVRWQDWSRHSQLDVRLFGGNLGAEVPEWMPRHRGFRDVWRFSAGVESNDRETYRVGARLRFETGAVANQGVTPMQVAGANVTLATGAELRIADHWVVNLGYELGWFPEIDVREGRYDPREYVACVDSRYDFDTCRAAREGRAFATGAGRYRHLQHGLVLSLRYDSL